MAIYKLGEIVEVIIGKDMPSEIRDERDEIFKFPIVSNGVGNSQVAGFSKFKLTSKNVITISARGTVGHVSYWDEEIYPIVRLIVLDPNNSVVLTKYLYYKLSEINFEYTGAVQKQITKPMISGIEISIPEINVQEKIIDIIEPFEKLYLTINSTVESIKSILKHNYELIVGDLVDIDSKIKLINSKYKNQVKYVATNAINEFGIDVDKIQSLDSEIPSRANVSPTSNSFIISKLDGENKIFYFSKEPSEVYSTGFFNFETDFVDHISGFLLSNSFTKQKEMYSTGTTMRGLNNKSLETIQIKESSDNSDDLTKCLMKLSDLQSKVIKIKNEMIKLLIK